MEPNTYIRRRLQLSESCDAPIVMSAYRPMQRGNDASFAFEQDAHFWYVTGIDAPDWWLIVDGKKSWLVAPDVDEVHQVFDGSLSWVDAQQMSGVDHVVSRAEAQTLLETIAKQHSVVCTIGADPYAKHYDFVINPAARNMQSYLKKRFSQVRDCRHELAVMRANKDEDELVKIQEAVDLTVEAFRHVKQNLAALSSEYEVEAEFTYHFGKHRGAKHAYDPIVATGKNACTLHYNRNKDIFEQGQLILIDIGARIGGYAADITRTYAIGTPTPRQAAVHAAVEAAHQQIIALLKPGLLLQEYSHQVDVIMKRQLISLGLIDDESDQRYRTYFPHAISHGLGIDVHDSLGKPHSLQPGMVLTVEPGIYIPEEAIGVRIEDDILITNDGHRNLSAALSTSL